MIDYEEGHERMTGGGESWLNSRFQE
jgi:hypothetical protein